MYVYDEANNLAKAIQESKEYKEYKKIKEEIDAVPEMKAKIEDFEKTRYEVQVMSFQGEKQDEEKITKDFRRGVSVLNARGGYTDKEKSVLITAVKIQEAAFITAAVKETDPKAFSVITGADEIIGEGFRY